MMSLDGSWGLLGRIMVRPLYLRSTAGILAALDMAGDGPELNVNDI